MSKVICTYALDVPGDMNVVRVSRGARTLAAGRVCGVVVVYTLEDAHPEAYDYVGFRWFDSGERIAIDSAAIAPETFIGVADQGPDLPVFVFGPFPVES